MKGSLIIVGFFVLGIVCGVMHWLPDLNAYGNVSFMTLCALLFCVGMTVGNNTTLLKSFTKLDPRLMLLQQVQALVTTHCQAFSSHNTVDPTWAPSPCWQTSSARFSRCWARHYWCGSSDRYPLSHAAVPRPWTPRCPSSLAPAVMTSYCCHCSMVSLWTSRSPSSLPFSARCSRHWAQTSRGNVSICFMRLRTVLCILRILAVGWALSRCKGLGSDTAI